MQEKTWDACGRRHIWLKRLPSCASINRLLFAHWETIYQLLLSCHAGLAIICTVEQVCWDNTLVYRPRTETATDSYVYPRDPIQKDPMESTVQNRRPTCAKRSDLAAALRDLECVMHWATNAVDAKSLSYENVLPKLAVWTANETAPPLWNALWPCSLLPGLQKTLPTLSLRLTLKLRSISRPAVEVRF